MKTLITTTINVPKNLIDWSLQLDPGDWIIIAGDQKSPHAEIERLLPTLSQNDIHTLYLTPQMQTGWESSDVIGWNSIQRRNIALLEAIALKPEWVLTVNDDGVPTLEHQLRQLIDLISLPRRDALISLTDWWDPGVQCHPITSHRGMPMSQRHGDHHAVNGMPSPEVGVAEMLIVGDPDVDAVTRICHNPHVEFIRTDVILAPGTWAPFNSEATLIRGDLAPLLFQWPGVGRYDDIWCSYLARCVMYYLGLCVYYGEPAIRQTRNEHDLLADLDAELFGMRHTDDLVQVLRDVRIFTGSTVIEAMMHAINAVLSRCPWIPDQTRDGFFAWFADLDKVGAK